VSTTLERPIERAPINKATEWRFLGRSVDFWLCATLTFAVLLVQGWNIAGYPTVFDDEGTYLAQAWAIDHGIGMAPYTYWFDHPPLGWIQIAALAWIPSLLFHGPSVIVVAYARIVMLPFTAASSILVYVLARRMALQRWAAALAVVLFGLSPLSVTLQREIFLDNIAVTWMLAALVFAYSPRKHLWHHIASGLCAGVAILSKETMIIVLPALIYALWVNVSGSTTRKYSFVGFAGAFGLLAVQYPLYAILKGELYQPNNKVSLYTGIVYQLTRQGSGSIFNPSSNGYLILHNWLYYDPVLITAGTVSVILALAVRRLRPIAIAGVILTLAAIRPTGYLPAMYIIQMLPFFALGVAGMVDQAVSFIVRYKARPALWQKIARLGLVAICVVTAVVYVTPKWLSRDSDADTLDYNQGYAEAAAWFAKNVPHPGHDRVVLDDTLWLNMINDGFKASRYDIYFFKLDVDPDVDNALPGVLGDVNGQFVDTKWKSITYVFETPYLYDNATEGAIPIAYDALQHSKVVWSYGTGGPNVELQIRKVIP
jgi:4-amino-4-deoxy-L-arabinose transferase-like glycosyltransferase